MHDFALFMRRFAFYVNICKAFNFRVAKRLKCLPSVARLRSIHTHTHRGERRREKTGKLKQSKTKSTLRIIGNNSQRGETEIERRRQAQAMQSREMVDGEGGGRRGGSALISRIRITGAKVIPTII